MVVFHFGRNLGAGCYVGGQGRTGKLALAVCAVKHRANVLYGHIGAHAHSAPGRVAVQMQLAAIVAIRAQRHGGEGIALRRLGHKVDQTTGRRYAGLQTGYTLEHFHALLVFHGDGRVIGSGQAVAQEVGAGIQQEATHRQTFDKAGGVVAVGKRGVELDGLRQAAAGGGGQQVGAQHGDALRCLGQCLAETAHIGVIRVQHRRGLSAHGDSVQALGGDCLGPCGHGKQQGQRGCTGRKSEVKTVCHRVSP